MILSEIDQREIMEPVSPQRITIDEGGIDELANSIRDLGLLQPIVVCRSGERFEVVAGHRRLLATRKLGLPRVQCLVLDEGSEEQVVAARLHENLIRRDITPVEEAALYAELFEKLMDVDSVAKMVKRSRSVVESRLNLLAGDRVILEALSESKINAGVAEQLNKVKDQGTRRYLLEYAIRDGATVEKVRGWRVAYAGVSIDQVNQGAAPITQAEQSAVPVEFPKCYLCGSEEDQHEIKWLPVHASCQRMVERQAERQQQPQEVMDGHQ